MSENYDIVIRKRIKSDRKDGFYIEIYYIEGDSYNENTEIYGPFSNNEIELLKYFIDNVDELLNCDEDEYCNSKFYNDELVNDKSNKGYAFSSFPCDGTVEIHGYDVFYYKDGDKYETEIIYPEGDE